MYVRGLVESNLEDLKGVGEGLARGFNLEILSNAVVV